MPESNQEPIKTRAQRRQEMVKNRRNERHERYNRNKREMMLIKWGSISLAVIVLGAIGFTLVNYLQDRDLNREPEGVNVLEYAAANHVEGNIDYSAQAEYQGEVPPAGGAHNSTPQQCDVYESPIRQEAVIHSMEHGAVWITYQSTLPQDQIDSLKALAEGDPYMMMSPYEGLPAPIVLTAWNHQLELEAFDQDEVERFIRSYKNKNGITPEFGASCSGTTMTITP